MVEEDLMSRAAEYGFQLHVCTAAFRARYEDEIDLNVGNEVLVIQAPAGGWWEGLNQATSAHGWFPRNHISSEPIITSSL